MQEHLSPVTAANSVRWEARLCDQIDVGQEMYGSRRREITRKRSVRNILKTVPPTLFRTLLYSSRHKLNARNDFFEYLRTNKGTASNLKRNGLGLFHPDQSEPQKPRSQPV